MTTTKTACKPTGTDTARWASCSCGSAFTGANVVARRAEHIASGEGNWMQGMVDTEE